MSKFVFSYTFIGTVSRPSVLRSVHTLPQLHYIAALHGPAQKLRCNCIAKLREMFELEMG